MVMLTAKKPSNEGPELRTGARSRRRYLIALAAAALFAGLAAARARRDAAEPPGNAPGRGAEAGGESTQIQIGGATITVSIAAGRTDLPAPQLYAWVRRAARAVNAYYVTFPVARARVNVRPTPGRDGVFNGFTFCPDSGLLTTRIAVGEHTTEAELADDWMMTHELVHMAFPSMQDQHHWIEEGMATYVEPIGRAQDGQVSAASVWKWMVEGLPQGEPEPGDRGLDNTHTWGRTYWGGALFCLMADVGIRRETRNRAGLQDALRGIVAAGGTMDHDWSIERALATGDKATGTKVLQDLYAKMKDSPAPVDLGQLWKELGVEHTGGHVTFRDDAPLAAIRKAITEPVKAKVAPAKP